MVYCLFTRCPTLAQNQPKEKSFYAMFFHLKRFLAGIALHKSFKISYIRATLCKDLLHFVNKDKIKGAKNFRR